MEVGSEGTIVPGMRVEEESVVVVGCEGRESEEEVEFGSLSVKTWKTNERDKNFASALPRSVAKTKG